MEMRGGGGVVVLLVKRVKSLVKFFFIKSQVEVDPPLIPSHFYGEMENVLFCKVILYINVFAVLCSFVVA